MRAFADGDLVFAGIGFLDAFCATGYHAAPRKSAGNDTVEEPC